MPPIIDATEVSKDRTQSIDRFLQNQGSDVYVRDNNDIDISNIPNEFSIDRMNESFTQQWQNAYGPSDTSNRIPSDGQSRQAYSQYSQAEIRMTPMQTAQEPSPLSADFTKSTPRETSPSLGGPDQDERPIWSRPSQVLPKLSSPLKQCKAADAAV